MELIKDTNQKSSWPPAGSGISGPSGYELQLTKSGYTETWKGKVTYFGVLEMLGGTYFHQLRFFSYKHPTMYLNFVFPKHEALIEGGYPFQRVPYEESGNLDEPVTEFYLPRKEDGFPEPTRGGYAKIRLNTDGYAIKGHFKAIIPGRKNPGCQLKGRFWLDGWDCNTMHRLSTTNFT